MVFGYSMAIGCASRCRRIYNAFQMRWNVKIILNRIHFFAFKNPYIRSFVRLLFTHLLHIFLIIIKIIILVLPPPYVHLSICHIPICLSYKLLVPNRVRDEWIIITIIYNKKKIIINFGDATVDIICMALLFHTSITNVHKHMYTSTYARGINKISLTLCVDFCRISIAFYQFHKIDCHKLCLKYTVPCVEKSRLWNRGRKKKKKVPYMPSIACPKIGIPTWKVPHHVKFLMEYIQRCDTMAMRGSHHKTQM